jgi:hypothetical protein
MTFLRALAARCFPGFVAASGLAWAAISVLDPFRSSGRWFGPLLVLGALALERRRKRATAPYVASAVLVAAYALASATLIEFRADSASYFAYLHSVAFDRDLDFRNEWDHFGIQVAPGRRAINVFSAGPAVVWSPFYLAAHGYVLADRSLGRGRGLYPADGWSLPYMRATALGTVTTVVLGALLLTSMMAAEWGLAISALSVFGVVAASPVLYYAFFVPAMAHGVAFGLAAALLWAWDRARRNPSARSWALLGATLGLLTACRWQGAVYGVLVGALAIAQIATGRARAGWLAISSGAGLVAFTPQILAWRVGFGDWILIPQGRGFLDFSSPHWLDTLVSADHGLFNWTPLMLVGFLGLLAGVPRDPLRNGGGLVVFGLTTWVNGSVPAFDWAGGDAFGARRYCLVMPLLSLGLATALAGVAGLLRRKPLLAPAFAVLTLALWNFGFVSHFRARKYPGAAPLERLARDQADALRRGTEDAAGAILGARGRALAYDVFSGEYVYSGLVPSGAIFLRDADERFLLRGWYTGSRRIARRTFRRALFPEACVAIPLKAPFPLRIGVSVAAPEGLARQTLALVVNGSPSGESELGTDWQEIAFQVDKRQLVPGENELCLRFSAGLPAEEGMSVAALVEKIQLP